MLTDAQQPTPKTQADRARRVPARRRASRRSRGRGGVSQVRYGAWRVDVEIARDPVTEHRRRISRQIQGTRADAEVALAKLRAADHDGRLPRPGTKARTVRAALGDYIADVEAGVIELAPKTVVTTRSARNTMCSIVLLDGRVFGDIRLSTLGLADIEAMFRVMRDGRSVEWVRRAGQCCRAGWTELASTA